MDLQHRNFFLLILFAPICVITSCAAQEKVFPGNEDIVNFCPQREEARARLMLGLGNASNFQIDDLISKWNSMELSFEVDKHRGSVNCEQKYKRGSIENASSYAVHVGWDKDRKMMLNYNVVANGRGEVVYVDAWHTMRIGSH